mgnify:CR=1 FL=1
MEREGINWTEYLEKKVDELRSKLDDIIEYLRPAPFFISNEEIAISQDDYEIDLEMPEYIDVEDLPEELQLDPEIVEYALITAILERLGWKRDSKQDKICESEDAIHFSHQDYVAKLHITTDGPGRIYIQLEYNLQR